MRYLIVFLLGLFSLGTNAAVKVDLYHTEVVLDQGQSDSDAEIQGMENVIVKVSGNKTALNNPVIKKALSNTSQYLTELGRSKTSDNQSVLKLGFNPRQMRELITQAQVAYWPDTRTNVLVWYVEDDGYQRTISWENVGGESVDAIKKEADLRGLPVTIPVGDFDDVTNIEPSDLWGSFLKPISEASSRYQPDAVLVVRAQSDGLRWALYDQPAEQIAQDIQSPMIGSASQGGSEAIYSMIDEVAQYYAKKNSVIMSQNSTSSSSVKVQISGLGNAMDFFAVENSLKGLPSVASLDVSKAESDSVVYTVHLLSDENTFEQELNRVGRLVKEEQDYQSDSIGADTDDTQNVSNDTSNSEVSDASNAEMSSAQPDVQTPDSVTHNTQATAGTDSVLDVEKPSILYYRWQ
ncbi:DUF2066 domain-containing protein [Vibrio sp.]|nr:DUF2066 domain-containing protein [Vibrio sp.]